MKLSHHWNMGMRSLSDMHCLVMIHHTSNINQKVQGEPIDVEKSLGNILSSL
jgi:hypothetical protein